MGFAFFTLGVVIEGGVIQNVLKLERGLHSQAARAGDQIIPVKEPQRVVEALLAHVTQHFRFGRKQNARETIDVLF